MIWLKALIALPILLAGSLAAQAESESANDSCLSKCEIFISPNGQQDIRCSCNKAWKRKERWSQQTKSSRSLATVQPIRMNQLIGVSREARSAVKKSSCDAKWKDKIFEVHSPSDLLEISQLNNIPLCDCLNYRSRFPLVKICEQSQAGEKFCTYKMNTSQESDNTPIRKLSWLDIQACEMNKNNYRKPASCFEANCKAQLPTCSAGYELENMADSGSCCPKYFCKKR